MSPHEQVAYDMGRNAALAAASWIIDGNTKHEAIVCLAKLMDAGDPAADDYLPAMPNLSGEWSGDPTPTSLYRDITGNETLHSHVIDALADAFEQGVADHFHVECERIIRAAAA